MIGSLVLAAATGLLPLAAGPAAAAPATGSITATACTGVSGVTVVVDFGAHGGTTTRCASGDPTSASQALTRAGFDQARVQRQPGFLCRIDGVPGVADDACVVTPPESAYWSFWTAKRGGGWGYQNNGVDGFDPRPGSVVGFAFGAGARPRLAPPAVTATTRAPAPGPTRPRSTSPTSPTTSTTPPPVTHPPAAASSRASTPTPTTSTSTAAAATPTAVPAEATDQPTPLSATPAAARSDAAAGGSLAPWVGVGAVALVGVAALARSLRRRRR